jgi:hypothetical protein
MLHLTEGEWHDKNVDIKFSTNDTFLEKLSSGTLKFKIFESQMIKNLREQEI